MEALMHVCTILAAVSLGVAFTSLNGVAAEFSAIGVAQPGIYDIHITGDIVAGDSAKFRTLIKQAPSYSGFKEYRVHLDSPGGSYVEGILLGVAFHETGASTFVHRGDSCYSACAFAFLGGSFLGYTGGWGPGRNMEVGANLGFHSFYSADQNKVVALAEGVDAGRSWRWWLSGTPKP
jgi:hypothetical protein